MLSISLCSVNINYPTSLCWIILLDNIVYFFSPTSFKTSLNKLYFESNITIFSCFFLIVINKDIKTLGIFFSARNNLDRKRGVFWFWSFLYAQTLIPCLGQLCGTISWLAVIQLVFSGRRGINGKLVATWRQMMTPRMNQCLD